MTDREKLILGWTGGIATLVIGYFVWRHERAIGLKDAAAQQAVQAAQESQYEQQLAQVVSTGYPAGGAPFYSSPATASVDSGSNIDTSNSNGDLEAILQAFLGSGSGQQASSQGGSSSTVVNPAGGPPSSTRYTGGGAYNPGVIGPAHDVPSIYAPNPGLDTGSGSFSRPVGGPVKPISPVT